MSKPFLLVSPASRGIGFHLARHLLKTTPHPVIATSRKSPQDTHSSILSDLPDIDKDRLHVLEVDVTAEPTLSTAADHIKSHFPPSSHHLHLAFLVPGILHPEKSLAQINPNDALQTFQINTLGPLLLAKHFSPFLPRKNTSLAPEQCQDLPLAAVMALMSARVGSISDNALGGWYSYRASKAGVNQIAKSVDIYLRQKSGERAMCVALHPGTVRTGLSEEFWGNVKEEKLFSPEFAAERLTEVVGGLGVEGRGRCWDWEGKEVPP